MNLQCVDLFDFLKYCIHLIYDIYIYINLVLTRILPLFYKFNRSTLFSPVGLSFFFFGNFLDNFFFFLCTVKILHIYYFYTLFNVFLVIWWRRKSFFVYFKCNYGLPLYLYLCGFAYFFNEINNGNLLSDQIFIIL